MAKAAQSPIDLATKFKIEQLRQLSEDKRKELEGKELAKKKELEELEKKTKKELEELEKQKAQELEEAERLLERAIEEAKIDERLWREIDSRVVTESQNAGSIEAHVGIDEEEMRKAETVHAGNVDYERISGKDRVANQMPARDREQEQKRKARDIYGGESPVGDNEYKSPLAAERSEDYDPLKDETVLDTIDSTRSALRKMGYKK